MRRLRSRPLSGRPLVSVVVPCYNYGRYLPRAVESVTSQPGVDVEVIIVDDASPDGSARIARALADADTRVNAVLHAENAGHIATYNDGLARCRGDYVALLSADDLLAPGSLARSASLFEARPDVALVYGRAPSFVDDPPREPARRVTWTVWDGNDWTELVCRRATNVIANPEAIVRRDVIERFGGYDARLPHAADLLFWLRAASSGGVGRIGGPAQAYYRIHGANMHLGEDDLSDLLERSRTFEGFLSRPEAADLRALVRTALAEEALARATREHDLGRGGGMLAAGFVDFAASQGVDLHRLAGWPALRRREAIDSGVGSALLSLAGRARRRIRATREIARIRRTGVA